MRETRRPVAWAGAAAAHSVTMTDDSARLQRQLARDPQRLREDVQALEDGTAPDRPSDADYSAFGRRAAAAERGHERDRREAAQ